MFRTNVAIPASAREQSKRAKQDRNEGYRNKQLTQTEFESCHEILATNLDDIGVRAMYAGRILVPYRGCGTRS